MSKTIKIQIEIGAEPARLFRALIDSGDLESWFCEHARVSLEEWQYDFWGKFTPEAPLSTHGDHPLVEYKQNREIKYAWRMRNTNTLVKFRVEASSRGTMITLIHEYVPVPRENEYTLTDYWAYALESLRNWVERGHVSPRVDFSRTPYGSVELAVKIAASSEDVFRALIDPDQLDRYISRKATVEPENGGRYDFGWGKGGPGQVLEIVENQRLSYTWDYDSEPPTIVSWTLNEGTDYTDLKLVHEGFGPRRPCNDYKIAWAGYLAWIKSLIEMGDRWIRPKITASDYVYQAETF